GIKPAPPILELLAAERSNRSARRRAELNELCTLVHNKYNTIFEYILITALSTLRLKYWGG
ncbi:MAG: hypothetical protein N2D54_12320, partial [Chloroflexota bacterium]